MVDATPAIRFEEPITVKAAAQFLGVSPSLVYVDVRRPKFAKYVAKRRSAFRRRPELIGHDRTPENLASLELGFRTFLLFAKEAGAITNDEGTDLELRCTLSLMRSVVAQTGAVDQSDEFEECLGLLGTASATNQGGVANASDATAPDDSEDDQRNAETRSPSQTTTLFPDSGQTGQEGSDSISN